MNIKFFSMVLIFSLLMSSCSHGSVVEDKVLDQTVDPCVDFFQYSCGNWLKENSIPNGETSWYRSSSIDLLNQKTLSGVLEKYRKGDFNPYQKDAEKLKDLYASCMNYDKQDYKAKKELAKLLIKIKSIKNKKAIMGLLGELHLIGLRPFFSFSVSPRMDNSSLIFASIDQGGFGLPDTTFYTSNKENDVLIQNKYLNHIRNTLILANRHSISIPFDSKLSKRIYDIEKQLALHSFSISELSSDPYLAFHPTKLDELKSITPHLDWDAYLLSLNNIKLHEFNITSSHFFSNLDKVFSKTSLEDLKSYIEWQVIEAIGNYSFKELREEAFNFNGKILNGLSEQRPQFKRCISFVDEAMGDSLGELYVQLLFPGESKKVSIDLISKIMQSMQKTILNANWMDDVTKEKALLKLSKVVAKVGYPDKIHDYSELNLVSDSWLLNKLSEQSFWIKKDLAKINMATDRSDWITTAQTNNAFYNPSLNDINFPAGILQSPNFELNATLAENYGAIGATVGHELTHGFDTNGREFDEIGNLKKWWSEEKNQKYLEKAKCIIDEFNQFTLVNGEHVDGANTQTENIADLGGLRVALDAYKNIEASERIDLKLFFTAYAQSWCAKNTPESEVLYNTTDYHAPMRYRVNGIVKNIPEFKDAFNCKINQPMNPENKCAIW